MAGPAEKNGTAGEGKADSAKQKNKEELPGTGDKKITGDADHTADRGGDLHARDVAPTVATGAHRAIRGRPTGNAFLGGLGW